MLLDGIDMTQWRLLASLAETNNLSAAAARIGITQSAASHALAKLRKQVGDSLFVRSGGGVTPTPFGARLSKAAQKGLESLTEGLATEHGFDPVTATRRFNIYLNDVGQLAFLPQLISLLSREAPRASLKVHQVPTERARHALAAGEVDLAIGFFTNLTSGFHQSLLYRAQYVCVARAEHPLFQAGMSLAAFLNAEHAIADPSGMAHAVIEQALHKHAGQRFVQLNIPDFVVLPMLLADSDLVAIMPAGLANAFAKRLPLNVMPSPIPLPKYDLKIYWHERFHRDPANRWLRRAFVKLFRGNGAVWEGRRREHEPRS
ncbi:LysR family transcriptional regulator [Pseudolabrys taiwanensis]|uniref:LysR family transcriptional regulator n=1 Tax=Pseudolabrys taiwanensis TaxID=331696 RepID=A0A346A1T8_9HYPH|nr:LysR family transcriptional regulator [Pseudolabrys taiwanensis]AXK83135.1 LysR family transcriptional regulator [Pseudolabrys taiwanensis]